MNGGEILDGKSFQADELAIPHSRIDQTLQRVGGGYATAVSVQRPRSIAVVKRRLDEEAMLAGERFYYGWGVGKDLIEGPSVKLAMAAARCWGNCAVDMQPVQDLGDSWVFTSVFIDLETGYTLMRQFRMGKNYPVHGKHDPHRKDDIRFQIGQSKAARNVILNAIPQGLIDAAMDAAKSQVREKINAWIKQLDEKNGGAGKGLPVAVDIVIKALVKAGATEERILAKLEIVDRKAIDVERLVILRGNLSALDDGEATHEELFPSQSQAQALAEKIGQAKSVAPAAKATTQEPEKVAPPAEPKPAQSVAPPPADTVDTLYDLLRGVSKQSGKAVGDVVQDLLRELKSEAASIDELTADQVVAGCRSARETLEAAKPAEKPAKKTKTKPGSLVGDPDDGGPVH